MYTFNVYYENADTDDEKQLIGTVTADTAADALEKAAQYYEIPSHDLVVERKAA